MKNVCTRCTNMDENRDANFFVIKTFLYEHTQNERICYDYVLVKYMYIIIG